MRFEDKYEIIRKIGSGSTSDVFLVRDRKLKKKWAAKFIRKSFGDSILNGGIKTDAAREIQILTRLDTPGTVKIIDVFEDSRTICLITDYIHGMSLLAYIHKYGPVSEQTAAKWLLELCEILDDLHNIVPPVIFCDLKPENIMLKTDGNLTLVDFGAAYQKNAGYFQRMIKGTAGYTAPELCCEKAVPDPRSDIYSLGVLGYFLVSGLKPFQAVKPGKFSMPGMVSRKWDRVLSVCLAENPDKRYNNCEEMAARLKQFLRKTDF